jgi:hypothetical protein
MINVIFSYSAPVFNYLMYVCDIFFITIYEKNWRLWILEIKVVLSCHLEFQVYYRIAI